MFFSRKKNGSIDQCTLMWKNETSFMSVKISQMGSRKVSVNLVKLFQPSLPSFGCDVIRILHWEYSFFWNLLQTFFSACLH